MSLPQLTLDSEILDALKNERPFIDVRAPIEFEQGSIPTAINLPLLDNEQRAAIGTTYKQQGSEYAVNLGHELIRGETKERRLAAWSSFIKSHPDSVVFCFRGGMRSQLVQKELSALGLTVPIVRGGFKRIRALLSQTLTARAESSPIAILSGFTGAGKTETLRTLAEKQQIQFVDLELRAHHRGSSFGLMPTPQPTPINFENQVSIDWLKLRPRTGNETVWIEDESRAIGKLTVPSSLFQAMSNAPVDVIERPRAERARRLTREYLTDTFGLIDETPSVRWTSDVQPQIKAALDRIQLRLGGARHREILEMLNEASFRFEASGAFAEHWSWVEALLEHYYDPVYSRHLDRISSRIRFKGPTEDWIKRTVAPV